jgi:hypothetical protein
MSQENVELVRQAIEAFNRQDVQRAAELSDGRSGLSTTFEVGGSCVCAPTSIPPKPSKPSD